MSPFEKIAGRIRHSAKLAHAEGIWRRVRPVYNWVIRVANPGGLKRNINGTDPILVLPALRGTPETYEPLVWAKIMSSVRPGDVFADVGSHYGLYTVALAKRVGSTGKVHAFEPDRDTQRVLSAQIELNGVSANAQIHRVAAGKEDCQIPFSSRSDQSGFGDSANFSYLVDCRKLDTLFPKERLDALKIDVEGFEEWVLMGAARLLADSARRPRAIFIEVHPYAWGQSGTSSEGLLHRLAEHGYQVRTMTDEPVSSITGYGHIYATPHS